jgi:hypothetical protein
LEATFESLKPFAPPKDWCCGFKVQVLSITLLVVSFIFIKLFDDGIPIPLIFFTYFHLFFEWYDVIFHFAFFLFLFFLYFDAHCRALRRADEHRAM